MSDDTPSQAEGERDDSDGSDPRHPAGERAGHPEPRRPPSQAEGDRDDGADDDG
ncbi:hypothetical protein [Streptomyces sp. RFCAC02]|uniref:hypothetical protein n=1 Tax=Streptomyces sp. RFCAC02 TaxID=2499143 RepID=UPI00143D941C|nr:hypothetical protein [Streptomyces sp. RFCAC02]